MAVVRDASSTMNFMRLRTVPSQTFLVVVLVKHNGEGNFILGQKVSYVAVTLMKSTPDAKLF